MSLPRYHVRVAAPMPTGCSLRRTVGDLLIEPLVEVDLRVVLTPVDEQRGRALHAEIVAELPVGIEALGGSRRLHVGPEAVEVEPDGLCVAFEVALFEVLPVREEQVMHLPELALRLRRDGGARGRVAVRVNRQRRELVDEPHLVLALLPDGVEL